jgi:hypothetical protein
MTIQTQTTSISLREFAFLLSDAQPIQVDSRDYGFDFNEDELGRELLAPLPTSLSSQSFHEVDAGELEKTSHYFLS